MKLLLTSFLISISVFSSAQKSWGIAVYQNSDSYKSSQVLFYGEGSAGSRKYNFNRISVAVTMKSEKFYCELELFFPDLNAQAQNIKFPNNLELPGGNNYFFTFKTNTWSARYETGKLFPITAKLFFRAGAGVNPYYLRTTATSKRPGEAYDWNGSVSGASVNVIPGIKYAVTKHLSIDVSLPFKVYDWQLKRTFVANPAIPIRQQTEYTHNGYFFESVYSLRAGVQYLFRMK